MSLFSRSSNKNPYRNGHSGSNHYQRRGILGNLMNVFGSGSSHDNYNNYPGQNPNQYNNYPGQNPNQPNVNIPNQVMVCLKCNNQIPVGSKFCLQCGERVNDAPFCKACGEKLPPNAVFCSKCGAKLNG